MLVISFSLQKALNLLLEHTDHLCFLSFLFLSFYNTKFASNFHPIKVEYKTGKGDFGPLTYRFIWSLDGRIKKSDLPKENISQSKTPKDHTSL